MSSTTQKKTEHYMALINDNALLVNSSKNLIRKRHNPLALKIKQGDVKAILRAAKSRAHSAPKDKRDAFCKLLCEMNQRIQASRNRNGELWREIIAWAITALVGLVDASSGLIISFIWIIKSKLGEAICKCALNGDCDRSAIA